MYLKNNYEDYAILFDMDGVICHTNPYHEIAFEVFFDRHKIQYSKKEFEKHMYGKHNSHIMTHFFKRPIYGEELAKLENEKESIFREIYKSKVSPINGFIQFLDELKNSNFKTAVATAAPIANMNLIVDELNIRTKMDTLLGSENVTLHKPHPEVYTKAAKNVSTQPQNAIVFEDSFSGVTAGLNADMKVIGVLSTHTKSQLPPCSLYINDYTEINIDIINKILTT